MTSTSLPQTLAKIGFNDVDKGAIGVSMAAKDEMTVHDASAKIDAFGGNARILLRFMSTSALYSRINTLHYLSTLVAVWNL